jgi:putative transposase
MKRRERQDEARVLTFSCNHRLPLLGNPAIRNLFAQVLAQVVEEERWRMVAWVVMPEHVHLLTRPAPG